VRNGAHCCWYLRRTVSGRFAGAFRSRYGLPATASLPW
jgi:hypothetical protein